MSILYIFFVFFVANGWGGGGGGGKLPKHREGGNFTEFGKVALVGVSEFFYGRSISDYIAHYSAIDLTVILISVRYSAGLSVGVSFAFSISCILLRYVLYLYIFVSRAKLCRYLLFVKMWGAIRASMRNVNFVFMYLGILPIVCMFSHPPL